MKIAVVRRECGPSWGGAERDCAQTVKALTELGHKVTLIARKRERLTDFVNAVLRSFSEARKMQQVPDLRYRIKE